MAKNISETSISEHDKKLLDLQHLRDHKREQLKQNYKECLANVKENPYLQVAIDLYEKQMAKSHEATRKQLKALRQLLNNVPKEDRKKIEREINSLEKSLA